MGKKENQAMTEAEKITKEKLDAIRGFNMNNMGSMWIDPERVPTEDEINEAKEMFEKRVKALQEKNDYFIADKDNALRVAKFLKDFVSNGIWTGRFFVGVIRFVNEFIENFIQECEKEPKDLIMDYGATNFAYQMLENYGGIGIESAKRMAEIWNEYVAIYDVLRDHMEWHKKEETICTKLQNRWSMLQQGYYLIYTDEDAESVNGVDVNNTVNDSIEPIEKTIE